MANKDKLYVKRYRTLKEHRAAVAARKRGGDVPPNAYAGNGAPGAQTRTPSRPATPARSSTPTRSSTPARTRSAPEPTVTRPSPPKTPPKAPPKAPKAPKTPARGTARGGSRASNNNRGRTQTSSGPKAGDTRRTRKGSKYVTQMYDGKKWVTGKVGGKG